MKSEVGRITPSAIEDAALDLGKHAKVDAFFVSCTTMRSRLEVTRGETRQAHDVVELTHDRACDLPRRLQRACAWLRAAVLDVGNRTRLESGDEYPTLVHIGKSHEATTVFRRDPAFEHGMTEPARLI